ncbi:MAG: hypothetical protein QM398_02390, partial [Thermoproteota archaeon]|nr:hypothetical protein [Thermoproteota archaeon]
MKQHLTLIVISTLVISMVISLQTFDSASANFVPVNAILINSPLAPKIYQNDSVPLSVTVNVLAGNPDIVYLRYSLDGKPSVTLDGLVREDNVGFCPNVGGSAFHVEASLGILSEGKHTLVVYAHATDGKEMSSSVEFTVDYDYLPPRSTFSGYTNHTATPAPTG